jgi:hypothetical protein
VDATFCWIQRRLLQPVDIIATKGKQKVNTVLYLTLRHEDVWGSACLGPRFLHLGTSWRCLGSRFGCTLDRRLGGIQRQSGRCVDEKTLDLTAPPFPAYLPGVVLN